MTSAISPDATYFRVVWGVEHDELDVPYVVRYRVRGGPR